MPASLTPEQRSLRARIGAYAQHAQHDTHQTTSAALAASPAKLEYWERQVDPDGVLPELERKRRAEAGKKAHYAKMALASARARRRGNEAT